MIAMMSPKSGPSHVSPLALAHRKLCSLSSLVMLYSAFFSLFPDFTQGTLILSASSGPCLLNHFSILGFLHVVM
ncbi:hypothetical protein G4228_011844 [Cervus hanglu yarkandensis]|nr:hypothetical protein G4228_011844 [Cervus hanglu yarkandensis]